MSLFSFWFCLINFAFLNILRFEASKLVPYTNTIDFLLTKRRAKGSTQKFLNKAIGNNEKPRIINIDKSGANIAATKT